MATLTITEYSSHGNTGPSRNQPSIWPGAGTVVAEQTIALTTSSQQCAAFNANTSLIELSCDTICYLAFGANPTAVINYHLMPANTTRIYAVNNPTLLAALT